MKLKNFSKTPIALPDVGMIEPGEVSRDIPDSKLKTLEKNRIVAAWLKSGVLVADDGTVEDLNVQSGEDQGDKSDEGQDEEAQKEELIAALAEYGIERNKRSSVETLQKLLEEAEAE